MRARNIKPGLFKNELLGSADPLITILFAGLWCSSDREGRLEDRPLRLCASVFPYRRKITEKKVDAWLDWLHEHNFIVRYAVLEKRFIQIVEFSKHQNPHRDERVSEIPALSSIPHGASTVNAPGDLDKSPEVARLIPNSGFLNPDSGFLIPESPLRADARARQEGKGRPETDSDENPATEPDGGDAAHALTQRIQAAYPAGLHRGDHWMLAERSIAALLDQGVAPDELVTAAAKYCEQQTALENIGRNEVMRPSTFFGGNAWRGPFPIPATKADTGRAEILARLKRSGT